MFVPILDQLQYIMAKVDELSLLSGKDGNTAEGEGKKAIFEVFLDKGRESEESKESPWIVPKSQIVDECASMQFAGSDTVGNAFMVATFHLLKSRLALIKLRRELDGLEEEKVNFEALEKLPYLTAVIKESLRLSHGVASSLPRVVGSSGSTIAGPHVPPGTVVSCASYVVHTNPSIFPDSHEFIPERWLDNRELEKYLVAFSQGTRLCLGINLTWCELYLLFGNIFR
ncbi:hypothetical protein E1B28_008521 [Marasmius oreades]|nr:uncharacterized protein E1B28_008521 [Marasmius oreades]KAG7092152.1 hypothetical protein E1B28_008521 [Marasmius oreades]